MNYAGTFDATSASKGPATHSHAYVHVDSSQVHAPADALIVPDAQLLFHGDFKRAGNDLIVSKDHHDFVLHDYFKGEKRAAIASPDGAHLTADIIKALVGEVQVSQAGNAQSASQVIGHVTKLQGSATIVRNGVSIILNMGDNVEKGDVVESGSNSTLGLTFIDGTVFGLSANARMVLNEMVYDPNGSNNSSLMSLVAGTISFVAGETAKHGDMKVDTPVATMGIRGTACLVEIDFTVPGVNQSPAQVQPISSPSASFQVLVEPDGTTGSYILFDKTTLQPIAIVNQAGQQLNIANGVISQTTTPLSPEIQKLITDVFQQKFSDNTNSNTKTTTAQTDSIIPTSNGFIVKLADGSIAQAFNANTGAGSVAPNVAAPSNNFNHLSGFMKFESLGLSGLAQVLFQTAELAGQTGDIFDFVHVGGTFHFEDINVGDRPSVTADFSSVTYTNASGAFTINDGQTSAAGLSALQFKDIATTAIKLFLAPSPGNTNNGDVTWIYAVRDNAFDFLAAGEKLTFTYHVVLTNNFAAAPETKGLDVTITVTGTNDRPQFSSDTPAPEIDFAAGTKTSGGNLPTHDPTSGTLAFTDVDLTDKHTVFVALTDAVMSHGGTIPPLPLQLFNDPQTLTVSIQTDSTGTGNGVIHWQLADLPVYVADFIPANETVTLTYTVTLTDSSGDVPTDSTTETLTVVITGTNEAAEVWIHTTADDHDNKWTTGANWETGLAPSATDDVIIITDQLHPHTPAYPATIDVTTAVAHSVTMNDFEAQSEDPAHQQPELDVVGGAILTVGADVSLGADSKLVNAGTVIIGGKLELMDTVDPQTHLVSLNLSEIINSGTLDLGQGGDIQGNATVTNTGTIDLQGGILNVLVDIANSDGESAGEIKVEQGATLALGSDGNDPGAKSGITGGTITVAGTLTLEQAIIADAAITNNSTGEIDLSGSAVLSGGTLDNGGKLKVDGTGNALHDESVTANHLIEVMAGAILSVDLGSSIANSGGTLKIDDGGKLVLDSATIDGGTINDGTASGTLGQFGAIEIRGSSKFDQGATLNNGFVTFDASPAQTVTLTLDNVTVNGTTITENVGSSIEIDETVKLTGNATIQGQSDSQPGSIINLGTLDVTGAATLHDVSVTNDHHVVQIESGVTLNLNNSTITGGTLNINGTLDSTGDSFITGVTIDNTANIHVSGGTLTIDPTPTFDNSGTILVTDGGTLVLDHEIISNGAADNHVGDGTIQVDTAPDHVSTLDLNDSSIQGGSVIVSGLLDSTGNSAISSTITNNGTIEVENGTLTLGGSVSGSGHIVIDSGATLALTGSDTEVIEFADGGNSKLELLAGSSLSSTAIIKGLAAGDEIDLSSIDYKLASATFVNGKLEVTDGTHTVDLMLSGNFDNLYFAGTNDGAGGTLVTIKDTDDAPVIADADKSESRTITELTGTTGSLQTDSTGGTIDFTDIDLTDRPIATIEADAKTVSWTGAGAGSLTQAQITELESAFSLSQTGKNNGTVNWTYSIADKELDFLGANQTLTLTANIDVNDQHAGGVATTSVTVTIHGSEDAPSILGETNPATQTVILRAAPIVLAAGVTDNSLGLHEDTFNSLTAGLPNDRARHDDFRSNTLGATFDGSGDAGFAHGSTSGVSAAPFFGPGADQTTYLSIGAHSSETITFDHLQNAFGLYWGSVDPGNTISFYDGNKLVASYSGNDIAPLIANGNQGSFASNGYVEFKDLAPFGKVVLSSDANAFEVDNISAGYVADHHIQLASPVSGTMTVQDPDIGDTLTATVTDPGVATYNGSAQLPAGLDLSSLTNANAITFDSVVSNGQPEVLHWTYNPANANFDFLEPGDTLKLTFNAHVTDGAMTVGNQPLTVNIVGTNASTVTGTNANDVFVNVGGGVAITGNGGSDTFQFKPGFGSATINDFNVSNDVINIDHTLFVDFNAIIAGAHPSGNDTIITDAAHDQITLKGVHVSSLTQQDFHFV